MYCKRCGKDIGDARFCPECGSPRDGTSAPSAYGQEIGEYPASWKRVDRILYALLGILLGGFGIHKFYSGKILYGVLYLVFCWTIIPSVLGLIEGILALTKKTEPDGKIGIDPDSFLL